MVGGGLAMTQGDTSTYPRLATEFGFIPLADTLAIAEAVVSTQRDWGNRENRRNAKTKYTLERVGVDVFKAEVERRSGVTFSPLKPYAFSERGDRIGWVEGIDGKHHLTLFIPSGRLLDKPGLPNKSGIAAIASVHKGDFRLTANQNIIIAKVESGDKPQIDALAQQYGLLGASLSSQRKDSMACVSFPTCPLAMAEAERVLPDVVSEIEHLLHKHGVGDESFVFRITGCPNGCGRAMLAEVGLIGRAVGRYSLYIGGNREGTRIPRLYKDNIDVPTLLAEIERLITLWAKERKAGEGFGDFVIRAKIVMPVLNAPVDFHTAV